MTQEARDWIEGVRKVSAELADLLEGELKRGVSLVVVRQTLARLMAETHPETVAKYLGKQ